MKIPQRGLGNVSFDEKSGMLVLGNKYSKRYYMNVAHTRKFMQTLLVASYCRRLVEEGRHAGIRELYYALKHTITGTRENTFEDQVESNAIAEDIEVSLDLLREQLNLTADRRGYLYGDILIRDGEDEFNASRLGRGGWAVPGTVEDIAFPEVSAEYILVVETAAMADRLIEEKFAQKNGALIVACQGQAPRGVRRLIQRLHVENKLPVIVFTDGDPWSFRIFASLAYGAIKTAYISDYLATPTAEYVGITASDILNYELPTDKLNEQDVSALKAELSDPRFKGQFWTNEIELMLEINKKAEQQALAKYGLDFVTDKYLPDKLGEMGLM